MKAEVHISCCLCREEHVVEIDLLDGWAMTYPAIDEEQAFCPDHAVIAEFTNTQCSGCVGGWGDCGLWEDFAYGKERRNLSESDFAQIRQGLCPRRVNGTMMVDMSAGKIENMDLSRRAPTLVGNALERAIKDYWQRYP